MTLAERLTDHCTAERDSGFGSLMGATYPVSQILSRLTGKPLRITDNVMLTIPDGCTWQTHDAADGGVQVSFTGLLPSVSAVASVLSVQAEVTAIVLRIGAAAVEVTAHLRHGFIPLPPFTLTMPLGS